MPSLNPVSRRELVRKLKGLGFEGPFPGGKHQWMRRADCALRFPIPTEARSIPGFIRRILRQAGITLGEWEKA